MRPRHAGTPSGVACFQLNCERALNGERIGRLASMAGRILEEDKERLRQAIDVARVVGEHVTLRSGGMNSLKGLCPFHDERTPSFTVNPTTGLWHCFGCEKAGTSSLLFRRSIIFPSQRLLNTCLK